LARVLADRAKRGKKNLFVAFLGFGRQFVFTDRNQDAMVARR
jgi:hypothetical protein